MERYDSLPAISARVVELVAVLGLKRHDVAVAINMSDGGMSQLCSGRIGPSDRTIALICTKYNVNEAWLRYGEGEMFSPGPEPEPEELIEDEIAAFIGKLEGLPMDAPQRRILLMLARLPERDWYAVNDMLDLLKDESPAD